MKKFIRSKIVRSLLLLLVIIFFRMFVGEVCNVPSNSMEYTIKAGSWIWINKLTYGGLLPKRWADVPFVNLFTWIAPLRKADESVDWGYYRMKGIEKPKRMDIIVFISPIDRKKLLVKRIVGLPGDTIELRKGVLYINNVRALVQSTIQSTNQNDVQQCTTYPKGKQWNVHNYGPIYLGKKGIPHYFVLGDNRSSSIDSRFWGLVPESDIVGKVFP